METNIIEGNKLIAEFDGWEHIETPHNKGKGYWNKITSGYAQWDLSAMKYRSSWGWLYPVIRKIAKIMLEDDFKGHLDIALKHWRPICGSLEAVMDINEVFPKVVQFIQWYNSLTPSK